MYKHSYARGISWKIGGSELTFLLTSPLNFHEFLPVRLLGSCVQPTDISASETFRNRERERRWTYGSEGVGLAVLAAHKETGVVLDQQPLELRRVGRHLLRKARGERVTETASSSLPEKQNSLWVGDY